MKKILFLPIIFYSLMGFSQTNVALYNFYSSKYDSCELAIYRNKKNFEISKRSSVYEDVIVGFEPFSKGSVTFKDKFIRCYDPMLKRRYEFLQVSDSLLIATKHTAVFVKGDTLKADD